VTWWKGVEGTLPTNEDRILRFVVGLTLEGVEEKGGTLQDAITAVNKVLAALDEMSGTTGTTSGGTTGGSTGAGTTGSTSGSTTGGSTGTSTGMTQKSTAGTAQTVSSTVTRASGS
jgi:hypothetical protein